MQYTYDTDLLVYTENVDGSILRSDSRELMQDLLLEYFGLDMSSMLGLSEEYGMTDSMSVLSSLSPAGSSMVLWQEMLPGDNGKLVSPLLESQYDVVYGSWPTEYNEIVLVLDENNELDDMALYALDSSPKKRSTRLWRPPSTRPSWKWKHSDGPMRKSAIWNSRLS